jgi:hypothetical protein
LSIDYFDFVLDNLVLNWSKWKENVKKSNLNPSVLVLQPLKELWRECWTALNDAEKTTIVKEAWCSAALVILQLFVHFFNSDSRFAKKKKLLKLRNKLAFCRDVTTCLRKDRFKLLDNDIRPPGVDYFEVVMIFTHQEPADLKKLFTEEDLSLKAAFAEEPQVSLIGKKHQFSDAVARNN